MLHFSGGEAGSHIVHSHVHHQLLVGVQKVTKGVQGLFGNWVETNVDDLELLEDF